MTFIIRPGRRTILHFVFMQRVFGVFIVQKNIFYLILDCFFISLRISLTLSDQENNMASVASLIVTIVILCKHTPKHRITHPNIHNQLETHPNANHTHKHTQSISNTHNHRHKYKCICIFINYFYSYSNRTKLFDA